MKKIKLYIIPLFLMGLFILPGISQAQNTHTAKLTDILPVEAKMVFELNTEVTNPIEPLLATFIKEQIVSSGNTTFTETELNAIADNNIFTLAMDTTNGTSNPEAYVSMYLSPDQFAKILAAEKASNVIKEVTYNGYTLYVDEYNAAVIYLNNELFIMCSNATLLQNALDKKNLLINNIAYKDSTGKDIANSFFRMYMDPSANLDASLKELQTMSTSGIGLNETLISALIGESISIAETTNGFKMVIAVKGDNLKIQQYNLTFSTCNFVPELYKLVTGTNLISYSEEYNLRKKLDDTLRILQLDSAAKTDLTNAKADFKTETGIDVDTEILPLLEKRIMVTTHSSGAILPSATLVLETGTYKDQATQTLIKLFNYLKTQTDADGANVFASSTYLVGNTSFNELSVDLFKDVTALSNVAADKKNLYLRMGVTSDGYLVISTAPNLSAIFRQSTNGIMDNTTISTELGPIGQEMSSIFFFSTDTLQDYVNSMLDYFASADSSVTDAKTMINKLLNPWHDIYGIGRATTDLTWSEINLNVNIQDLSAYADLIDQMASTVSEDLVAPIVKTNVSFCDVKTADWFYDYVYQLASHNIISGYPDGCFRPGQAITRAEYITLLMKATGKAAAINTSYKPFTDVPPIWGTWYSEYVNMAAYMNFVDGYSDGTFRPNANITRAEAVQILFNMSGKLPAVQVVDQPIESLISFNDVDKHDWFMVAVAAAKHYGLVSGVTPTVFEPDRNITRAEAAKIVKLFLELENS